MLPRSLMRPIWLFLVLSGVVTSLGACEERHSSKCQRECEAEGRCTRRGEACVVTDAPDCERSELCSKQGRCTLTGERCVAVAELCRSRPDCKTDGLCGVANDSCAATNKEDCAPTMACRKEGHCSPVDGRCAPAGDDCQKTEVCKLYGKCSVDGIACVTKSSTDCQKGEMCERSGYCTFVGGRCQLTGRGDCEKTVGCRDHGVCEFVADNRKSGIEVIPGCVVGTQADCQRSRDCKEKRYCRLVEGVCGR